MSGRTVTVRLEAAVQGFQAGMRAAAGEARNLGDVAQRNSSAFTAMGAVMAAAGAAITIGMSRARDSALEFESSLTKMVSLVDVSREQVDLLGASALRMGHTGKGPLELADALFFVTSSGLRGVEALQALNSSAMASSIGLGETKVVADLVTSAMNAYGSETLSASAATDVLVGTVRAGKAEASELAGAMGRVLPVASEMGVQFHEVGAAVAAMTRTGSNAAEATTQLRAIMSSLMKPAQQSEQALREFGLSSEQLRATIRERGLWAALTDLRGAIGDNDEALGRIFPNVRALSGFLDLTGANAATTDAIFRQMADTMGTTSEAFREWSTTSEASIARFSAAMESVGVALGSNVVTPFDLARDSATGLLLAFHELPGAAQGVVAWGTTVAGVAATLAGGFLLAAPRINATKAALADLATSMPKTVGLVKGLGALLTGPLGIGLALAAAGVVTWAQAKAELNRRAENLLMILGNEIDLVNRTADSYDRLADATRRQFAQSLIEEHKQLVRILDDTGLALDDVARVLLGDTGPAFDRVQAVLGRTVDGYTEMHAASGELRGILEAEGAVLDETAAKQAHLNSVTEDGEDAFNGMAGGVDNATTSLDDYVDALRAATDPAFAMFRALEQVADAQDDYNEAVKEFGRRSPQAESAAIKLAQAVAGAEGAALDADLSFDNFEDQLRAWVRAGLLTESQARAIGRATKGARGEAERYRGNYDAHLRANVDRWALNNANQLLNHAARNRFATLTVRAQVTGMTLPQIQALKAPGRASGGPIGGVGGPRDDRNLILASRGEFMIQADAVKHFGVGFFEALNNMQLPQGFAGGGPVSSVQVPPTRGGSAAQVVQHFHFPHYVGAPAELMKTIRKEVRTTGGGDVQQTFGR